MGLANPLVYSTLIRVAELAGHLTDPRWIVFDCRHDLVDTKLGSRAYAHSRIPGARFQDLDQDLSGTKTGANGRHPLPEPGAFCARLAALGMSNDQQAVAYDASGGYYAARLWWMLRWVGHERVAVLDGGWDVWLEAGLQVDAAPPSFAHGTFQGKARAAAVDAGYVEDHLEHLDMHLIDARSPDRFHGENETLDPVGGHIPGALNRFFKTNLGPDGRFKAAAELKREFSELLGATPAAQVVHQCGSGVTACHNLLAMEIAGCAGSKLYPGSWSEWCSNPARPIAR